MVPAAVSVVPGVALTLSVSSLGLLTPGVVSLSLSLALALVALCGLSLVAASKG